MYIRRRHLLVLLLIGSQLGCMAFGVVWATQWLRGAFDDIIHRTAAAQARSIALECARRIAERPPESLEPGTPGWERLQQLCEGIKTPHDGVIAVIRLDTGELICHSQLEDDPPFLGKFPGRAVLATKHGAAPLIETIEKAGANHQPLVFGRMEYGGQVYDATCLGIPRLNAALVVNMSVSSLDHSVAELVNPLTQVGFVLTSAVVSVTGLLTVFLVKRFDSTLSEVSASVEQEVDRRTLALQRSRSAVVFGLAKLAESRDKDAGQHLERVRTYVTILATELAKHHPEIDHRYVANLAVAAALHDVGKMGVPDAVILKLGRLTPAERRAMQMHTVLGGECLASVARLIGGDDPFLELGREVASAHHEQWDGSGYPVGLQGKEIPLSARIVAVADVYDALTSHRAYRPAVSHADAREWIVSNYGSQFDPEVVEAFVAREFDFAKISQSAIQAASIAASAMASEPSFEPVAFQSTPFDAS